MEPSILSFVLILIALLYLWVQLVQLGRKHNLVVKQLDKFWDHIEELERENNELFICVTTLENRVKELQGEQNV